MADIRLAFQIDAENPVVGDIFLENGTMRLTNSLAEEVAQELWIRLRFFKGEWFLDKRLGMPYLQSILGVKTPLAVVSQIYRQVIIGCPGVASLVNFSLKILSQRAAQVVFSCRLKDGTILNSKDFGDFIVGGE